MSRKLLVALVIAIPLTLAACGDDDDATTIAAGDTTAAETSTEAETTASGGGGGEGGSFSVSETEYELDPSGPFVEAGAVTIDVSNDGEAPHDLVVEGDGVSEQTETLQPGDTGQLTADLKPGTYTMYCSIDGHADLGMEGEITVQ